MPSMLCIFYLHLNLFSRPVSRHDVLLRSKSTSFSQIRFPTQPQRVLYCTGNFPPMPLEIRCLDIFSGVIRKLSTYRLVCVQARPSNEKVDKGVSVYCAHIVARSARKEPWFSCCSVRVRSFLRPVNGYSGIYFFVWLVLPCFC